MSSIIKIFFNRVSFIFVFVIHILLTFANLGLSQIVDNSLKNLKNESEFFFVDPLIFYEVDSVSSRLDLYLEVPYKNLQFKKDQETKNYTSIISYQVEVKNNLNEIVVNNSYQEAISFTKNELKQNSSLSKYKILDYLLKPGNYNLSITVTDKNNEFEKNKNIKLTVKDFKSDKVTLSDIMIASKYSNKDNKKILTPSVKNNVGDLKHFYLFYEIYNNSSDSLSKEFIYKIIDDKNSQYFSKKSKYDLAPGINKVIEKISTDELVVGEYKLNIIDNSNSILAASKNLEFKWTDLPINITNLDLAIKQLVYIATPEEFDKINDAKTNAEKEKKFIQFWLSKDPNPETQRNELMIEYYNRIRIANERYSHYIDGWKTDMGMVFIIYGEPNNIERHPFNENTKPYEIWEYYDINKEFVFMDDTGFGDYRLTTPIWDDWRRR